MKRSICFLLSTLLLQSALLPAGLLAQAATFELPAKQPPVVLPDGTPVKLRLNRAISSKDAKIGDTVDFEVVDQVKIGDLVVIPQNAIALATVTKAKPNGRFGKGGKLDMSIDSVRLISGDKATLRAVKESKGDNRTGTMTGALIATGILFFPAAPIFLFIKGKNITIPKGTEVTAYINGDVPLDNEKLVSSQKSLTLNVQVRSNPDGAEIEIDGQFVGSTPSTIPLAVGEHLITVKKAGFVLWEKSITVIAGSSLTVDAALEKNP